MTGLFPTATASTDFEHSQPVGARISGGKTECRGDRCRLAEAVPHSGDQTVEQQLRSEGPNEQVALRDMGLSSVVLHWSPLECLLTHFAARLSVVI
jgi:hypothetical protein